MNRNKGRTIKNKITEYLEKTKDDEEAKIKEIFGNPEYVNLLQVSLRSEIEILLNFIIEDIDMILEYVLKDPPNKEQAELKEGSYAMISRNIAISLSSSSNKLRTRLSRKKTDKPEEEKDLEHSLCFQKSMLEFIDSENANSGTSNHWGRIMTSFVANPKYTFFLDEIDTIVPKLILKSEYTGYRDLIQSIASQNTNENIFKLISEGIADNMREYSIYSKDLDKNKEILDLLYDRTFYLLKIINQCYGESTELYLGSWENKYEIVQNLLEATLSETKKKLVLDAGVTALCIVMDIINKSNDDDDDKKGEKKDDDGKSKEDQDFDQTISAHITDKISHAQIIRKMVKAAGKSFYSKLGLYKDKIDPETIDNFDLIIRTFPIFWEAGINVLSRYLFKGCKVEGNDVNYPDECIDTVTYSKIAKTITDKVCTWISIVNKTDLDYEPSQGEQERAKRKLTKFIEENKIVENLEKHFPRKLFERKEEEEGGKKRVPFLNPFVIILAELLSVGFIKPKVEYNGNVGESSVTYSLTALDSKNIGELPQTMQSDEFTRFIFEEVIPVSYELNKIEA